MRETRHDGKRPLRPVLLLTAGLLMVAAALIAAIYFWSPHANLRVTIGPPGSPAYRFITAFASVTEANHPRVRIKLVQVADLAASANAVIPANGETIAILRRDIVAFVVRAGGVTDMDCVLQFKLLDESPRSSA